MASPHCEEPSWAATPKEDAWSLLEIKGGVEIAKHRLFKSCTLLGRASDDISLAHESCSRFHARIAFDSHGTPWLRDLQSVHGTTVNRKKLPAAALGKTESTSRQAGSRGVILYPGDVLQFGASTRMYYLQGPSEYERGALRKVDPTAVTATARSKADSSPPARTDEAETSQGVSWGMDMDDEETMETQEASKMSRSLPKDMDSSMIPEKHRQVFERLMAKRYKLSNLENESGRILVKGELSQGQESQLHKNEERSKKLQEEIDQLEQELYSKLFPEKNVGHFHKKLYAHDDADHEDDDDFAFYDRTKESDDQFDDGETQQSLTKKWKSFQSDWKHSSNEIAACATKQDKLAQRIQASDANDEDTFFLQNDLDLAKDSMRKSQKRRDVLVDNLKETERLLRIVNADLEFDRETGFIGEKGSQHVPPLSAPPPPKRIEGPRDSTIMPPPPPPRVSSPRMESSMRPPPASSMLPPPPDLSPNSKKMLSAPPAKRKRVMGPAMPSSETAMPPPPAKQTGPPVPMGTLAVLVSAKDSKPKASKKGESSTPDDDIDPKQDVWKAPADQDGSGFTRLNTKFAGRY